MNMSIAAAICIIAMALTAGASPSTNLNLDTHQAGGALELAPSPPSSTFPAEELGGACPTARCFDGECYSKCVEDCKDDPTTSANEYNQCIEQCKGFCDKPC